jgi:hypothetical protein
MIDIQIVKPVKENFRTYFDQIIMGKDDHCDLIIESEYIIVFKIKESVLFCHTNHSGHYYHNQKKVLGTIQLKQNDELSFEKINIKIKKFEPLIKQDINEIISNKYKKIFEAKPQLKKKLEKIEEKLFLLEQEIIKDVQK